MSIINSTMYGMLGLGQSYSLTDEVQPKSKKPELGNAVNEASIFRMPAAAGPTSFEAALARYTCGNNGQIPIDVNGSPANWSPGGGLSFNRLGFRQYQTYRAMDDDATLNLAIHLVIDPIIAAIWTVEGVDKDTPEIWVDLIRRQVLPSLQQVLTHSLRSLNFGWQPFEKVWSLQGRELWCGLRAHYPDYARIYLSSTDRQYAGLSVLGSLDLLIPNKSLVITHNGEATDLYGHSKHDAAYEAYCDAQKTRFDLARLRSKISGILPTLMFPPGKDSVSGIDNSVTANQILQTLGIGYGVAMPSLSYTTQQMANNPKLANLSPWQLTIHDTGSLSPAIGGYLAMLAKYDVDKFRAWSLPERTGLEGHHGTKAEAGQHSDNSVTGKELIASAIAYQLTHGNPIMGVTGWIDDILLYNFGQQAVGQVELKCPPLADNKLGFKADFLQQLFACNDPALVAAIVKSRNLDNVMDDLGIASSGEAFNVDEYLAASAERATSIANPDAQPNVTPPGGPKGVAKVSAALKMAGAAA